MRDEALRDLRQACERHEEEIHALIARALSAGAPTRDIADALGVSRATLWRRYGDQLRRERPTG